MNSSCIPDNKEFHSPSQAKDQPFLYCVLPHSVDRVRLADEPHTRRTRILTAHFRYCSLSHLSFMVCVAIIMPASYENDHNATQWQIAAFPIARRFGGLRHAVDCARDHHRGSEADPRPKLDEK